MENLHLKNLDDNHLRPRIINEIYELAKLLNSEELIEDEKYTVNSYNYFFKYEINPLFQKFSLTYKHNFDNYNCYKELLEKIMKGRLTTNFMYLIVQYKEHINFLKDQDIITKEEQFNQTIKYLLTLKKDYENIITNKLYELYTLDKKDTEYLTKKQQFIKEYNKIMKTNANKILEDVTKIQTRYELKKHDKNFIKINKFTDSLVNKINILYTFINNKHIRKTNNYFKPNEELIHQYINEELQLHTKKIIGKLYKIKQKEVKTC